MDIQTVLNKQIAAAPSAAPSALNTDTLDKLVQIVGSVIGHVDQLQRALSAAPPPGTPAAPPAFTSISTPPPIPAPAAPRTGPAVVPVSQVINKPPTPPES